MLPALAVAVFRKTDAPRHSLCDLFSLKFSCVTLVYYSTICSGMAATAQTVVESELCLVHWVGVCQHRVSRDGPQTMCCGNFVAVHARFPTIANVPLGFLQSALILDRRTLGKGTSARSSSVPPPHNSILRLRCKLTAHGLDGRVLLSGMWQRMLVMCSWLVDASVSHVEFVHGTNKRRACRSELWAHFISKHILKDIMCAMKHVPEACRAFGRAPLGVRTPRVRTSCIKDVFSKDLNRALQANTTSMRANTLECADELAQGFLQI